MTIDEVIAAQTEALRDVAVITHPEAQKFVMDTINYVLRSIREEMLDKINRLG